MNPRQIMYAVYRRDRTTPSFIIASDRKWKIRGEYPKESYRIVRIEVTFKKKTAWDIYQHKYKRI